jgi:hypothetical protein
MPPHVPQVPFMQTSVLAVQEPAQQGCPVPPHAVQVPEAQTYPSPQLLPPQQGWLGPPQAAQVPLVQTVVAALQAPPAQQASPMSPHATHWLVVEQTAPVAQVFPQQD